MDAIISATVFILRLSGHCLDQTSSPCSSVTFFTKVVTQMVQFLPDSRTGDILVAEVDLESLNGEEEDFELAETS